MDLSRHLTVINTLAQSFEIPLPIDNQLVGRLDHLRIMGDLTETFPLPRAPDRQFARQLALDLALSSTILFSEPLEVTSASSRQKAPAQLTGTPDDDFARAAGQLSLRVQAPPRIRFSLLAPLVRLSARNGSASPSTEDDPEQWVQGETARSLMAEWNTGTDPRTYMWKGWREDEQGDQRSGSSRPIRPLPSPRSTQTTFARPTVQPNLPTRAPTFAANTSDHPQSSPLRLRSSEYARDSQIVSNTQVERGPFGGRPTGTGKKKAKKRVGGF